MNRKSRTRALRSTDLPASSAVLAAAPHPVRATRHHGNPFNSPCSDITFAVALFYMSESVQPSIYFTGSEQERGMRVVLDLLHPDTHSTKHREHFQKSVCSMELFSRMFLISSCHFSYSVLATIYLYNIFSELQVYYYLCS